MEKSIVVHGLGKKFRQYHADRPRRLSEIFVKGPKKIRPKKIIWGLRNVSFEVKTGKIMGVIGRNGSGKSTLLRLIGGVYLPDEGSVRVKGRIGALLDLGTGFQSDLTGKENVYISGVIAGLSRKTIRKRFESIVDFSELEQYIDYPLRTYSSGMIMRLAFAVAVHIEPEVLIIDEVLAVGDLSFQNKCLQQLSQFKKKGCTIFLVSHDLEKVENFCDEVLWLQDGKIAAKGNPKDTVTKYFSSMAKETQKQTLLKKATEKKSSNSKLILEKNRFGSLEAEITNVRILDSSGYPTSVISNGAPLSVEIEYYSNKVIYSPIFGVDINQENNMVYLSVNTISTGQTINKIQNKGKITLHIDRLDLNSGEYFITVGIYEKNWSYAYDYHWKVYAISIQSKFNLAGIISPPHRWII